MPRLTRHLLLGLLVATFALPACAQSFLLLERSGVVRSERFPIGEPIRFQLVDDEAGWYIRHIEDLQPRGQLVRLGDTWYGTQDIRAVWLLRKRVWPNIVGGALQGGGATMILGDLWYTLRGNPEFTQGGIEFGVVNIAVGAGLRALLSPIRHKMGERKRLRVVDLTF